MMAKNFVKLGCLSRAVVRHLKSCSVDVVGEIIKQAWPEYRLSKYRKDKGVKKGKVGE